MWADAVAGKDSGSVRGCVQQADAGRNPMQELHCFLSQPRCQWQLLLHKQPMQPLSVRKTRMVWMVLFDAPSTAQHFA